MPFLVIVLEVESCPDTVFGIIYLGDGTTLPCCSDLPRKSDLSFCEMFDLVLGCSTPLGCCKIGLSAICIIGFLPSNNFHSDLSYGWETGNLSIFFFIPALP